MMEHNILFHYVSKSNILDTLYLKKDLQATTVTVRQLLYKASGKELLKEIRNADIPAV